MDWLDARLRELPGKKTKAGAGRAIGQPPSRISEIVKGKRQIQQREWAALARYLDWTVEQLHEVVSRISQPQKNNMVVGMQPLIGSGIRRPAQIVERLAPMTSTDGRLVPVREAKEVQDAQGSFEITSRVIDSYAAPGQGEKSFAFYCQTDDAHPYERGDRLLINPDMPLMVNKKVLFLTEPDQTGTQRGLIRSLLSLTHKMWHVVGYVERNGVFHPKEDDLGRADWPICYRIVGVRHPS